jgi:hypothetical protein
VERKTGREWSERKTGRESVNKASLPPRDSGLKGFPCTNCLKFSHLFFDARPHLSAQDLGVGDRTGGLGDS